MHKLQLQNIDKPATTDDDDTRHLAFCPANRNICDGWTKTDGNDYEESDEDDDDDQK